MFVLACDLDNFLNSKAWIGRRPLEPSKMGDMEFEGSR